MSNPIADALKIPPALPGRARVLGWAGRPLALLRAALPGAAETLTVAAPGAGALSLSPALPAHVVRQRVALHLFNAGSNKAGLITASMLIEALKNVSALPNGSQWDTQTAWTPYAARQRALGNTTV